MTAVQAANSAAAITPVMPLHLAPKDALMATERRRIRTITTQHTEEPITIAPGDMVRASDIAALIAAVGEEARSTEHADESWVRRDPQTGELFVGFTVTTETRS